MIQFFSLISICNSFYPNNRVIKFLDSGQFGNVYLGTWENREKTIKVALKKLKGGASKTSRVKFLQEAVIMSQFDHSNVIKLLGVVLDDEPVRNFNFVDGLSIRALWKSGISQVSPVQLIKNQCHYAIFYYY